MNPSHWDITRSARWRFEHGEWASPRRLYTRPRLRLWTYSDRGVSRSWTLLDPGDRSPWLLRRVEWQGRPRREVSDELPGLASESLNVVDVGIRARALPPLLGPISQLRCEPAALHPVPVEGDEYGASFLDGYFGEAMFRWAGNGPASWKDVCTWHTEAAQALGRLSESARPLPNDPATMSGDPSEGSSWADSRIEMEGVCWRLEHPGTEEPRTRAGRPLLRVWRYPTFSAYQGWCAYMANGENPGSREAILRRATWNWRSDPPEELVDADIPVTHDETTLPFASIEALRQQAAGLTLETYPTHETGRDGRLEGCEFIDPFGSARLRWWCEGPKEWAPLRTWYDSALAELDANFVDRT